MKKFAALLLAAVSLLAAPFTIEQVLSSPFPDNLVASPRRDAVAWVLNAKGVRNIWVARAPEYRAAAITRFTLDDGQEISDLAWTPDSSAVVFTRGGDPNAKGESPDPAENVAGAYQEIWLATVSAPQPRRIGYGHGAAISPDGSKLVWLYSGALWGAPLDGKGKPEQLTHVRGYAEDLVWSPDGARVAFTSLRGDHSFIGIYDAREKLLRFVDASVDTDQAPVWSPDGKQLAHVRIPAEKQDFPFGPKRIAQPWSIRVVDAATGAGHEIWRAHQAMGSVFSDRVSEQHLLWAGDGRIVFPWEGDGWLHLYSVAVDARPASDASAALLTPGDFEVQNATLTPDRKSVVFASNETTHLGAAANDDDRRHLWRVPASGGAPQAVTTGLGIEWSPAPLADGRIALLHSDAKMPARAALRDVSGSIRDLAPETVPAHFPASSLVEPQPVIFSAADGMRIHGQLFLPANPGSGKHPAVIFFHGGSERQMLLGWHYMFYYHQAYGFNQYLANKGYVVLSVNYRSGIGYGEQFREALHYGAAGASEFNDVLGAGLYLRGRSDVDPAHIGLWGGSYGGYLTALGLARASDLFAAGVDLHGVHDWNLEIPNFTPSYDPTKHPDYARIAFESSPIASVSTWRSPVLLIQGDDDRNVAFSQSVQMAEALRKQGVYFEQLIFPDEVHDFLMHAHWLAAFDAADRFLGKFLKPE